MTTFTHAFILGNKQTVTIEQLRSILAGDDIGAVAVRAKGFYVISDMDKVVWDQHGRPSRDGGGWSYGHVQSGWICAGAGGLNSSRIAKI